MDQTMHHSHHHPEPEPPPAAEAAPAGDPPAGHGMAVIGERAVYFSHLPMFMVPHCYQVILHVELEGDPDPQAIYFDDRSTHPRQGLYTFEPADFVLPELFPEGEEAPKATSFQGDLHRGHFERGSTNPRRIAEDVTVRVRDVIHQHKLDSGAERPEALRYLLFGGGAEIFAAHLITAPPDFDQLLSVEVDQQLSDDDLRRGIVVRVHGRADRIAERIDPSADSELRAVAEIDGRFQPIVLGPRVQYYFETGDLAEAM